MCEDKSVYETFDKFTHYIYNKTYSTWQISLDRLAKFLFDFMVEELGLEKEKVADVLVADILKVGGRKLPKFLREFSDVITSYDKLYVNAKSKRQQKRLE
jgi:hypothetical protein